jgi:DMSO/TMAO reductase YedYZ heme-binding membrane subunit
MKRAMYLAGGALWLCFALGFAAFLWQYLGGGAGLQFFGGPVSSASLLLGLVHLAGFGTAILLCFAIGVGLCARSVVGEKDEEKCDRVD